jgi:hypothetical protein
MMHNGDRTGISVQHQQLGLGEQQYGEWGNVGYGLVWNLMSADISLLLLGFHPVLTSRSSLVVHLCCMRSLRFRWIRSSYSLTNGLILFSLSSALSPSLRASRAASTMARWMNTYCKWRGKMTIVKRGKATNQQTWRSFCTAEAR